MTQIDKNIPFVVQKYEKSCSGRDGSYVALTQLGLYSENRLTGWFKVC